MDKDFLRNMRVRHVDVLWRRANRDVDSVQAAVRLLMFMIVPAGLRVSELL
jgi:hypothetical protein